MTQRTEAPWVESTNDVTMLMETANKLEQDQKWAEAITAWREVAAHPCAWHVAYVPEVFSEIAETHRRLGQYDAAIQAWREAIKLGYSSNPLPECNIAELLLESVSPEAFSADIAQFLTDWVKPTRSYFDRFPSVTDYEDRIRKCEHCGYTQAALDDVLRQPQLAGVSPEPGEWPGVTASSWPTMPPEIAHPPSPPSNAVLTALAWFLPDQWAQALTRWPTLAEDNNSKHTVYCQQLDAHLRRLQDAAPSASHLALAVAPIRIEHYLDWCEHEGEDPAARAARSSYAANQARLGDIIDWPPAGRQHPCRCGSGRKYKRCCAPRD